MHLVDIDINFYRFSSIREILSLATGVVLFLQHINYVE